MKFIFVVLVALSLFELGQAAGLRSTLRAEHLVPQSASITQQRGTFLRQQDIKLQALTSSWSRANATIRSALDTTPPIHATTPTTQSDTDAAAYTAVVTTNNVTRLFLRALLQFPPSALFPSILRCGVACGTGPTRKAAFWQCR